MLRYHKIMTLMAALIMPVSLAQAGGVFKCEQADGSITFSDTQCGQNYEGYEIKESYQPDPNALHIPKIAPPPAKRTTSNRPSRIIGGNTPDQRQPASTSTAYKCTQATGRVFYSASGCGSSDIIVNTNHGPAMTTGTPFKDTEEVVPSSEACAWATDRGNSGGLPSNQRRAARSLAGEVCERN